jgi:hypothetical protein
VLNVNDGDAVVNCSQLSVALNTNQVCSVNVTNAGLLEASSVVIGDDNPAGEGRVNVSGRTQVFPPELSTMSVSGSMVVGRDGKGLLNVSTGGLVAVGATLTVGQNVSAGAVFSDGVVRVGGGGLGFPSSLSVGSGVRIGRGSSSITDTGQGLIEVNDDGVVTVAGSTLVGGSGLGSGVLRVNTGGRYETAGLIFGASGDFQHVGGRVVVSGGGFTHDDSTLVVSGAADTSLELSGLASPVTYAAASGSASAIVVGDGGVGTLTLAQGTRIEVTRGKTTLGQGAGSSGSLVIESGAIFEARNLGEVAVGDAGDGNLTVRSGGTLDCEGLFVSLRAGAGTVLLENLGSIARIGAATVRSGGSVTVRDEARIELDGGFGTQFAVQPGATLALDRGTIQATTDVLIDGTLTMVDGTIIAREFRRTVPVAASGEIRASILSGPRIAATDDLILGDGGNSGLAGTDLDVGPHRVRVEDSDGASLRIVTIAGGELACASGFTQPAATSTTGFGVMTGDFQNNGSLAATSSGLIFRGLVSGVGQGMSGTKFTFANGGGFTGAGTIAAKVQNDIGARMTFTGNSTIGDGSTTGFIGGGELDITGLLTINDSNGVVLGSLTTLRAGTLRCNSTMTLGANGELRGAGLVDGLLTSAGTVSPGIPGGDETSQISINGDFTQLGGAGTGSLIFDIEGPANSESDLIFKRSGTMDLRGRIEVRLRNGFSPVNGFQRSIMQAGSIIFNPSSVVLPPRFHLEVGPNFVRAVFCSADFNEDGFVDFFDYDEFVECFETGVCPAGGSADFNEDDFVDFFDYDDFVSAFETGC